MDNLDAAYDAIIVMPVPNTTPTKIKSYAAGTVIQMNVANHAGGATNTVYLFGFLY
jgi:flavoprotein